MTAFVNDGFADMPSDFSDQAIHQIRIEVSPHGNLIRDLIDYPLSRQQALREQKNGKWLLEFPSRRTHQLIEYIVARGSSFTVLSPPALVQEVVDKLKRTLGNYPGQ